VISTPMMFRYFLLPFVSAGWLLANVARFGGSLSAAEQYGAWAMFLLPASVALAALLVLAVAVLSMVFAEPSIWPGPYLTAPFGAIVSGLALVGLMRGTQYAVTGVQWRRLRQLHLHDPIQAGPLLITAGLSVAALLCLERSGGSWRAPDSATLNDLAV
jgi:hypothetical protein